MKQNKRLARICGIFCILVLTVLLCLPVAAETKTSSGSMANDGEVSDSSGNADDMFDADKGEVSDDSEDITGTAAAGTDPLQDNTADNGSTGGANGAEGTSNSAQESTAAQNEVKDSSSIGTWIGIIIAIIIAVAVIILIIVLIPRRRD